MIYLSIFICILVILQMFVLLVLFRQVGLIIQRLPTEISAPIAEIGMKIENVPNIFHDIIKSGKNRFLFASLSCPLCRVVLKSLFTLSHESRKILVLMLLDENIDSAETQNFLREHNIQNSIDIMNGFEYSRQFSIRQPPFFVDVDESEIVKNRTYVREIKQLEL